MENSMELSKVVIGNSLDSNIISGSKLRLIQSGILKDLANAIKSSMGPAGSNTLILSGNNDQSILANYSKDGNKIIKNIKYSHPIEMGIKSQIEDITRHIEKTVGDGTSSAVVMSHFIFDSLVKAEAEGKLHKNPYQTMRDFKNFVDELSKRIESKGRECTIDDIKDITFISTNGNQYLTDTLVDIYNKYGMGVYIDVSAAIGDDTYVKEYNGITLDAGFYDPCMINNVEHHSAHIRSTKDNKVRVYNFMDPIDTTEQFAMFQKIIMDNIINHYISGGDGIGIPTVILAPTLGRDTEAFMRSVVEFMNRFGEAQYSIKPPLLIISEYTGIGENFVDHITQLCDARAIKKYIDDKMQKKDQDEGRAPTLENICDFCGFVGEVEADDGKTKFVDPERMYKKDENGDILYDENDAPILSDTYSNLVNSLKAQYINAKESNQDLATCGSYKRQLNAITRNMVEIFIGGISIADRDALRDLTEDAVLNCRSAAANGVGFGTNAMGLIVLKEMEEEYKDNYMYSIFNDSYHNIITDLYTTIMDKEDAEKIPEEIIKNQSPLNINNMEYDKKVLTSIESEPAILDTISKIVMIMFTANQALLQAPNLSMYY